MHDDNDRESLAQEDRVSQERRDFTDDLTAYQRREPAADERLRGNGGLGRFARALALAVFSIPILVVVTQYLSDFLLSKHPFFTAEDRDTIWKAMFITVPLLGLSVHLWYLCRKRLGEIALGSREREDARFVQVSERIGMILTIFYLASQIAFSAMYLLLKWKHGL